MKGIFCTIMMVLLLGASDLNNTGVIRGTVRNADTGELLPISLVLFYSLESSLPAREILTQTGSFTMIGVPPGRYRAYVSHSGFRSFVAQEVEVKADSLAMLSFLMRSINNRSDSTDVVKLGKPGVDYKMNYFIPKADKFR